MLGENLHNHKTKSGTATNAAPKAVSKIAANTITIQIGKNGITQGLINEIAANLRKKGIVKLKFLRSFAYGKNSKEESAKIAEATGAILAECRGFTAILRKR